MAESPQLKIPTDPKTKHYKKHNYVFVFQTFFIPLHNKTQAMKIYTSYFAKEAKLRNAGITPIGIAVSPPKYFFGTTINSVAPTRDMLSKSLSEEQYTKRYKEEILAKLNLDIFLQTIRSTSQGRDVALCCYEKPADFCHRRLLADFIKEKTGIEIEEFDYMPKKELAPKPIQQSLF